MIFLFENLSSLELFFHLCHLIVFSYCHCKFDVMDAKLQCDKQVILRRMNMVTVMIYCVEEE